MNNLDIWYQNKLKELLNSPVKGDRTGTGTHSSFGHFFEHKMSDGFPLLTTKKLSFKNIAYELFWFLKGDTNVKYLIDNNVNIWNGDAYKHYLGNYNFSSNPISYKNDNPYDGPCAYDEWLHKMRINDWFASFHGDLGPIYGKQWTRPINQITNLINTLRKNPDDRRMIVSAWNPTELNQMVLPPCHYAFQIYTRELRFEEQVKIYGAYEFFNSNNPPKRTISLMWHQRSCDFFLGVPYNIASYALLLKMLGQLTNMIPEYLKASFGDLHLYTNHIEQAKEQCEREPKELPEVLFTSGNLIQEMTDFTFDDFSLIDYNPHPNIGAPLSN